jgi:hypothetical protein
VSVPFDLTCWYINARRVIELAGAPLLGATGFSSDNLQHLRELGALKDAVVAWIKSNAPETLGKMLVEGTLSEGSVFTHNSNFFFKGLSAVASAQLDGKAAKALPTAYSKLDEWLEGGRIEFEFDPVHLTSNSSWSELTGQKRMFVLGVVTSIKGPKISTKPYVIANVVENRRDIFAAGRWMNYLEVHVDRLDSFERVRDYRPRLTKKSLEKLSAIPEAHVKEAFAEIIGEPVVPKDWGGEKSDLFSTFAAFAGTRISAAFAFKGPSKFKPMTMAELGKNGDQISRLFEEPAELLVLQHCHEITPDVRKTMRAFANQMGNPRMYCVIDGYDTIRVLEAYSKCGLSASAQDGRPVGA